MYLREVRAEGGESTTSSSILGDVPPRALSMPDWFDTNVVSVLNGLAIGSLLFMLAVGLSLVFGMMDVLNLAHGAVYLVGAYVAYALIGTARAGRSFVAAVVAALAVGRVLRRGAGGLTPPLAGADTWTRRC